MSARTVFIECAQQLLTEGPRARYLGICGNIDELLSDACDQRGIDYASGYNIVAMFSECYADFKEHNPGFWGERGSEGDLFRYQWLREKIALAQSMTDEQFQKRYDEAVGHDH